MFFFPLIVTVTDRRRVLAEGVRRFCPFCGRETAHRDLQACRQLALFFIPVWRWDRRRVRVCIVCGTQASEAPGGDAAPPGYPGGS